MLGRSREFAPHFQARRIESSSRRSANVLGEAFALRFQVYCTERGFLNPDDHPEGLEYDAFDDEALHCLAYDRAGRLAGYVRLIHGGSGATLPWEAHCPELLPGVVLPDPETCAEVSRLMVRSDFRRRRGDLLAGVSIAPAGLNEDDPERRTSSPQIMLSLFKQMFQHSQAAGILHWHAAMERPLVRALGSMGFAFQRIGAETNYYGPVSHYIATLDDMIRSLEQKNPALLAWMRHCPTAPAH